MRELIDFLKAKISVKDMVEIYSPASDLTRSGRQYACRCLLPDHDERTASFTIYEDHFYCFGCRVGGDVIRLVLLIERGTDPDFHFRDAIHRLKTQCIDWGLATDEDFARLGEIDLSSAEERLKENWKELMMKHGREVIDSTIKYMDSNRRRVSPQREDTEHGEAEDACTSVGRDSPEDEGHQSGGLETKLQKYQRRLRDHKRGQRYLKDRGISMETAEKLGLGWSEREHGIVFPVRDLKGRALGYQVRLVPEDRDE